MSHSRGLSLALVVTALVATCARAAERTGRAASPQELTVTEAASLATLAFDQTLSWRRHPPYSLDGYSPEPDPRFFSFEALGDWPGSMRANLGDVAVDRRTGEVWNYLSCNKVESVAIKRLQLRLRRILGLTAAELRAAQLQPGPRPGCNQSG